jgi:formylglycine-generating enzyme required for sulfatase activity/uncharacterized caspase-like protein
MGRNLLIFACAMMGLLLVEPTEADAQIRVQESDNVQRRALLIGVTKYEKAGFRDLDYPEADVSALAEVLHAAGFQVTLMLGSLPADDPLRATRENIGRQLLTSVELREAQKRDRTLRRSFVADLANLSKSDIVLIAFAGHGRQQTVPVGDKLEEAPYFCPVDAANADVDSWVSISELMETVSTSSGSQNNLILVDACRDNPGRGRGIDGAKVTLPGANLAICFSSSAGTEAYEAKELQHGIFTYHVLQGLRGEAANRQDQVTWDTLVSHIRTAVAQDAPRLVQRQQLPNAIGNVTGASPVLIAKVAAVAPANNTPPANNNTAENMRNTSPPSGAIPAPLTAPFDSATAKSGQAAWANHLGIEVSTINSVGLQMILIPPGEFMMGSAEDDVSAYDSEKPQHRVTLTNAFLMAETEVTQGQWKAVMGTEPWKGKDNVTEGANYPATYINHEEAEEFCRRLSEKDGRLYRLPTEAEWEYACRAGTTTTYSFGNDESALGRYAWYDKNAWYIDEKFSHLVRQKQSNAFGLYDMHGNVWEWCSDCYAEYTSGSQVNPIGPESGVHRVYRGSSWRDSARNCRAATRNRDSPSLRLSILGFRPVSVSQP